MKKLFIVMFPCINLNLIMDILIFGVLSFIFKTYIRKAMFLGYIVILNNIHLHKNLVFWFAPVSPDFFNSRKSKLRNTRQPTSVLQLQPSLQHADYNPIHYHTKQ